MAKAYVSTEMYVDDRLYEVGQMDQWAMALWPWFIPALDDWGRCEANARRMKLQMFAGMDSITVSDIERILCVYAQVGLVHLYTVDGTGKIFMAAKRDSWYRNQSHIPVAKREDDSGSRFPRPPVDWGESLAIPANLSGYQQLLLSSDISAGGSNKYSSPSPSPSLSPSPSPSPSSSALKREKETATVTIVLSPEVDRLLTILPLSRDNAVQIRALQKIIDTYPTVDHDLEALNCRAHFDAGKRRVKSWTSTYAHWAKNAATDFGRHENGQNGYMNGHANGNGATLNGYTPPSNPNIVKRKHPITGAYKHDLQTHAGWRDARDDYREWHEKPTRAEFVAYLERYGIGNYWDGYEEPPPEMLAEYGLEPKKEKEPA